MPDAPRCTCPDGGIMGCPVHDVTTPFTPAAPVTVHAPPPADATRLSDLRFYAKRLVVDKPDRYEVRITTHGEERKLSDAVLWALERIEAASPQAAALPAPDPFAWLNGWPRSVDAVLIGTCWHCAGCGKYRGMGCIAVSDDDPPLPTELPRWPFPESDCPICARAFGNEGVEVSPPRAVYWYQRAKAAERDAQAAAARMREQAAQVADEWAERGRCHPAVASAIRALPLAIALPGKETI